MSILLLIGITWAVQALWWIFVIGDSHAFDMKIWHELIPIIQEGRNPYLESRYMNYPPVWYLFLYLNAKINTLTGWPLLLTLRATFLIFEAVFIAAFYWLLSLQMKNPFKLILFTIALNPLYALHVLQHGNI